MASKEEFYYLTSTLFSPPTTLIFTKYLREPTGDQTKSTDEDVNPRTCNTPEGTTTEMMKINSRN